jgi:NADPH:quinone reductase-like Zn-dependent oxidoreductase
MIGLGFRQHGGSEQLTDVTIDEPAPRAGEVRVRLEAAAFNRLDGFVLQGIPGVPIDLPHVVGSDGAGRVDQLGECVDDLRIGDPVLLNPGIWDGTCPACRAGRESLCRNYRILGEHTQGTATAFTTVPRRNVHPRPEHLTAGEAASMPLVFQTAYRALTTIGELQAGDRLAVIGAGGGVATAVLQIGRMIGAQVAVVSRSPAKAERAVSLGADAGLVMTEDRPLDAVLWEWSGKQGIDVIFDSVGAPTLPRSVRALARGGRVVVIGATAGPKVEVDVRPLFWRQTSIRGSTMASRSEFDKVYELIRSRQLVPVVDHEFPWADRRKAWDRFQEPDLFGKVVLDLTDLPDP